MKPEETERLYIEGLFKEYDADTKLNSIEKLTGDASTRKYFRLTTEKKTFVVCLDNPKKDGSSYEFEDVQKIFKNNNIRVPELYYINREKGFLLEEDLGNRTLLEDLGQAGSKEAIKNLYIPIIDELIKIHSIDYSLEESKILASRKFDKDKLIDETRLTNANFLIKLLGCNPEDQAINIIDQSFLKICSVLEQGPWVVTHRDFHSRNVMRVEDKPVIIDFQDARLGLPQYDLVSLLEDCYFFVGKEVKSALIEYYLKNSKLKMDDFEKIYDLMAIQRLYKAIGSFSMIYNTRGDSRYLKFVGRAFETVLAKLGRYEQFLDLKLTLAKIYYAS